MSQEIIYTSAPAGLKPGSRGFCTVLATRGMAKNLADHLEDLSGYRHLSTDGNGPSSSNPVAYSHLKTSVGGRTFHVLSRIGDAGLDYTQRTNKLAHHVALEPHELPPGGPAAALATPGVMAAAWSGEPHIRDAGPVLPKVESSPAVCQAWQKQSGDAGWGGVVAAELAGESRRPIVLIYRSGIEVLPLIVETLALLPASKRRAATFSTYVTKLPPTVDCRWRCYIDGTPEAEVAARQAGALVLDLRRPLGRPEDSAYVDAARTGRPPRTSAPAGASVATDPSEAEDNALIAALMEDDDVPAPEMVPSGPLRGKAVEEFGVAPPPVRGTVVRARTKSPRPIADRRFSTPTVIALTAAALLIVVGVGIAVTFAIANRTEKNTAAAPQEPEAKPSPKPVADPTPQKSAAENSEAATKPSGEDEEPKPEAKKPKTKPQSIPGSEANEDPAKSAGATDVPKASTESTKSNDEGKTAESPKTEPDRVASIPATKKPEPLPTSLPTSTPKPPGPFYFEIKLPATEVGGERRVYLPKTDIGDGVLANVTLSLSLLVSDQPGSLQLVATKEGEKLFVHLKRKVTSDDPVALATFHIEGGKLAWESKSQLKPYFSILQHSIITAHPEDHPEQLATVYLTIPKKLSPVSMNELRSSKVFRGSLYSGYRASRTSRRASLSARCTRYSFFECFIRP